MSDEILFSCKPAQSRKPTPAGIKFSTGANKREIQINIPQAACIYWISWYYCHSRNNVERWGSNSYFRKRFQMLELVSLDASRFFGGLVSGVNQSSAIVGLYVYVSSLLLDIYLKYLDRNFCRAISMSSLTIDNIFGNLSIMWDSSAEMILLLVGL